MELAMALPWVNFFILSLFYRKKLSVSVSVKATDENVVGNKDFIFIRWVKRRAIDNPSVPFIIDRSCVGTFRYWQKIGRWKSCWFSVSKKETPTICWQIFPSVNSHYFVTSGGCWWEGFHRFGEEGNWFMNFREEGRWGFPDFVQAASFLPIEQWNGISVGV